MDEGITGEEESLFLLLTRRLRRQKPKKKRKKLKFRVRGIFRQKEQYGEYWC